MGKLARFLRFVVGRIVAVSLGLFLSTISSLAQSERPNILLVVADDLGYSDLGAFGSEISTPNLDNLAKQGVIMTQFHAAPNCGPSRAAMLTGVDYHRAGLGGNVEVQAENQRGLPAYQGFLRNDVVTMSELLRDAGYHTAMVGKWHLGHDARNLPGGRGFKQSFALLNGAASHWADKLPIIPGAETTYTQDDAMVSELPKDFYSTTYYTDQIIEYIEDGIENDQPFFAYLAYTAPHNPLHAPDSSIKKYQGRYDDGWDELAKSRKKRQQSLGLFTEEVIAAARPDWVLSWDELTSEQQQQRSRDMEIFAGMVDYMDHSIGRLINRLRDLDVYDNTLIVFLSDNGPSKTAINDYLALGGNAADFVRGFDNSLQNKGKSGSSTDIGPGWAYASATPLRLFKGYVAQGGIQVPAIIKLPGEQIATSVTAPVHITDLMPTFLQAAGIEYPATYGGTSIAERQGRSLFPLLINSADGDAFLKRGLGWEAYGMDAWRQGNWKLLRMPPPFGSGQWQLYDLKADPGETKDLSADRRELVRELSEKWEKYAQLNEVVHPSKPIAYAKPVSPGKY